MSTEKLKELRTSILNMSVQPPWCECLDVLKKWTEGFEECQINVLFLVDNLIKEFADERKG